MEIRYQLKIYFFALDPRQLKTVSFTMYNPLVYLLSYIIALEKYDHMKLLLDMHIKIL